MSSKVREGTVIPSKTHEMGNDIDQREANAARISAIHRESKSLPVDKGGYGEANSFRAHILKLSLFPNIYNQKMLLRQG